jgi:hypothetical protein
MNQHMSEKEPKSAIETQIVENLRRVYNQKLEEDVPDRLLDLLKQLKVQDGGKPDGGL